MSEGVPPSTPPPLDLSAAEWWLTCGLRAQNCRATVGAYKPVHGNGLGRRQRKRDRCACPPVPRSLLLVQHRHHAWSLYFNIPKDEVLLVFDRSDLYATAQYERRDYHNAYSNCFHWQTSYWGLAYPCGNHHQHESVIVERTNLHWLRPVKHPLR